MTHGDHHVTWDPGGGMWKIPREMVVNCRICIRPIMGQDPPKRGRAKPRI